MKIHLVGAKLSMDGQTDRQTWRI